MNNEMKNMSNREDLEFVGRIQKAWGRPELSAAEAARFDRALRERMNGRARNRWGLAAALAATAAVIALVVLVPGHDKTAREGVSLVEVLGQAQEIAYGNGLSWEPTASVNETASNVWPNDYDPDAALNTLLSDEYQALAFLVSPPEI
ncbi:MAG: hypothetical protein NT009_01580 [Proteobacteria bacterium]|nr:hypothetical protein [Pseudomonadota bacterium]